MSRYFYMALYNQVEEVSLGDEVGSTRVLSDSTSQVSTPSSPNGKIILSQLTGKVNNDASKVVDENGEPLVVVFPTPVVMNRNKRRDKSRLYSIPQALEDEPQNRGGDDFGF